MYPPAHTIVFNTRPGSDVRIESTLRLVMVLFCWLQEGEKDREKTSSRNSRGGSKGIRRVKHARGDTVCVYVYIRITHKRDLWRTSAPFFPTRSLWLSFSVLLPRAAGRAHSIKEFFAPFGTARVPRVRFFAGVGRKVTLMFHYGARSE